MKRIILAFCFIVCLFNARSQDYCTTVPKPQSTLKSATVSSYGIVAGCNSVTVNVYFHFLRDANNSGGYPIAVKNTIMNLLNAAYNQYGIYFRELGYRDYIKPFYLTASVSTIERLFYETDNGRRPDAINIYLLSENTLDAGKADGIPSNACVIGGKRTVNGITYSLVPSNVVTHEVGHCLGLFHTFEGSMGKELVNGSNCSNAGDLICDTPADPAIEKECFTSGTCSFNPSNTGCHASAVDAMGNFYAPDTKNIMSYTIPSCQEHFTPQQSNRSKYYIPIDIIYFPTTITSTGSSNFLCSNQSQTFNVPGYPDCLPITWSFSPDNIARFTPVGKGTYCYYVPTNASGEITITASLYNGQVIQTKRWMGAPIVSNPQIDGINTFHLDVCPGVHLLSINATHISCPSVWKTTDNLVVTKINNTSASATLPNNSNGGGVIFEACNDCGKVQFNFGVVKKSYGCGTLYSIKTSPNPIDNELSVAIEKEDEQPIDPKKENNLTLLVYNQLGEIVYQNIIHSSETRINTSNYIPGIYFVVIKNNEGVVNKQIVTKVK